MWAEVAAPSPVDERLRVDADNGLYVPRSSSIIYSDWDVAVDAHRLSVHSATRARPGAFLLRSVQQWQQRETGVFRYIPVL